jgi:hypothetical protein
MLADLSNSALEDLQKLRAAGTRQGLSAKSRFLMLALNFIPLLHAASIILALLLTQFSWSARVVVVVGLLYLAPPLLVRSIFIFAGTPQGHIPVGSKQFLTWWLSFQLQVLFCRIPVLEEVLRLVPGLYSQWLRLWGSRVGRFTYWSPGTIITDRSFLAIGDHVVLGAGVRLNSHVLTKGRDGLMELIISNITIGERAMVGGYSLLTAGTEISPEEITRAFLISPPFSVWSNGKRVREIVPDDSLADGQ